MSDRRTTAALPEPAPHEQAQDAEARDTARERAREERPERVRTAREELESARRPAGYTWVGGRLKGPGGLDLPTLLIVERELVDVDSGRRLVELAWLDTDGAAVIRRTVDLADAQSHRKVPELANYGLPVSTINALAVARYLTAYRDEAGTRLARTDMTSRLGWHGDRFVAGPDTPGIEVVASSNRSQEFVDAHRPAGTLEGWRAAVEMIAAHDRVLAGLAAGLSSVLLRELDRVGCVVEFFGGSSRGKTLAEQVGLSPWGLPTEDGLLLGWNSTVNAITGLLSTVVNVPLGLDDTQTVERRARENGLIGAVVYAAANGQPRERSNRTGGLQDVKRWRTVLLSTGERSLLDDEMAGGAAARVVSIPEPLEQTPENRALVDVVKGELKAHHGHAGPVFVERVLALGCVALKARWDGLAEELARGAVSAIAGRRAGSVAVLALAAELAVEAGLVSRSPAAEFWRELVGSQVEGADDRPRAALEAALRWAQNNPEAFWQRDQFDIAPHGGWAGGWPRGEFIAFDPSRLREVLDREGYAYDDVKSAWREQGWTDQQHGRFTRKVRGPEGATEAVKVPDAVIREVLGEVDE